ncbi:MAG: DMT family transporter [Verrucomicrobiales bacterium]|nr:DMT family transporter [Verrucomicrobiales bacterium]
MPENVPVSRQTQPQPGRLSLSTRGVIAVVLGAAGIGLAPIWIRHSQLGPFATAAHRMLLAAPFLYLWSVLERPRVPDQRPALTSSDWKWLFAAGFFFAGDMALWNWSLHLTTVANSTLITNLTPLLVMIAARIFLGETVRRAYFFGMPVAFLGALCLVGSSSVYRPEHLKGDLISALAIVFYAGYLLTLRQLRQRLSSAQVLSASGLVSCVILFTIAFTAEEQILPAAGAGWLPLLGLALISHVGGQGLIAYGFGHVPAAVGSLILLVQPVVATFLAWWLLGEKLGSVEILGAVLVLAGIVITTMPSRNPRQ